MSFKINESSITQLIESNSNDKEMLDIIFNAMSDFEDYHQKIYEMETKLKIYSHITVSRDNYIDMREALDKARSVQHNAVIMGVKMLNRLAQKSNSPLVYEGTISEEQPFRREIADAVLEYVENIIKRRR